MLTIKFRGFALALLLALLTGCSPAGPRALLQGKRLIEEGNYPEAVEKLKTATVLLGTNALASAQAWNYLGVAYQHAGDGALSEKAYQHALALNHDLAEAHYNLGCLLLSQNKLEAARTELTAYTLRRGNSPEGFLKLGMVQLRARDLGAAEKSFDDALRISPQNPEALNGLGLVRVQQRRLTDAAQCFNNALKAQPDYRQALLNLAVVEQNYLRDRSAALQRYRQYLALKPAPANSAAVAEIVRQLEQEASPPTHATPSPPAINPTTTTRATPTEVARNTTTPRTESPTNSQKAPPSPQMRTTTSSNPAPPLPNSSSPATSAPVEVVKLTPEPSIRPAQDVSTTSHVSHTPTSEPMVTTSTVPATASSSKNTKRGFFDRVNPLNLFHGNEKTPSNITPLPRAEENPGASPIHSAPPPPVTVSGAQYHYKSPAAPAAGNRTAAQHACEQAIQAYQAHRIQEAAQDYWQATQLDPSFYEAHYNYGLAATDAGNLNAALTAYEYALAIKPDATDARYNFALVLKQAKYFGDSANELEKLLSSHPNEARAHLALANLYAQQLSQPDRARQHYLKVLELDPHNPQASAIRYWLSANPAVNQ